MSVGVPGGPGAGLCDRCRHQQIVRNTRGSAFSLCRRSRTEPERFVRYPPLPVQRCAGFEAAPTGAAGGSGR
ncbi:MAG: hypothetical protein ACLPZR_24030 [Solirubrobacteraceae bacterium]